MQLYVTILVCDILIAAYLGVSATTHFGLSATAFWVAVRNERFISRDVSGNFLSPMASMTRIRAWDILMSNMCQGLEISHVWQHEMWYCKTWPQLPDIMSTLSKKNDMITCWTSYAYKAKTNDFHGLLFTPRRGRFCDSFFRMKIYLFT